MITNIKAANFKSWESLNFPIINGVTLVDGFNFDDNTPEGSGKSAILNAMCWGIYGKIPEPDFKIDDVIRDNAKGGGVELNIDHPIIKSVYRTRGSNDIGMIDINGKVIKGKDARETQQMIIEVIGMSYETFLQTIYFAQGYSKKFVTETQEERGKILAEIQDLKIFDKARKETLELIKHENSQNINLKHTKETIEIKVQATSNALIQQREFIKKQREDLQQGINNLQAQVDLKIEHTKTIDNDIANGEKYLQANDIKQMKLDIPPLKEASQSMQTEIAKLQAQKSNISKTVKLKVSIQSDISNSNKKLQMMEKEYQKLYAFYLDPNDVCNACGTVLGKKDTAHAQVEMEKIRKDEKELKSYIEDRTLELSDLQDASSEKLDKEIAEFRIKLSNIEGVLSKLEESIKQVENFKIKLDHIIASKNPIVKELSLLDSQLTELKNTVIDEDTLKIQKMEEEEDTLKEQIVEVNSVIAQSDLRISRLEMLKSGFKEVKSFAFNTVLNELTHRANNYLVDLFEMPIKLKFTNENMKIGLKIITNGNMRGYGAHSGGQKRRIGLAVDLSLSDIVSNRTGSKLNLIILDEYFKDLSESSMIKCLNLLERLNKPVILIEHNSVFKSIVNKTVNIELRDGITRMA